MPLLSRPRLRPLPLLLSLALGAPAPGARAQGVDLKVSADGRRLEKSGAPVLWLCDTQYLIWHHAKREDVDYVLARRKQQGFTFIKSYFFEPDGDGKNAYGDFVFADGDTHRGGDKYFAHCDYIVSKARELGLYLVIVMNGGNNAGTLQATPEFYGWAAARWKAQPHILWWVATNDDKHLGFLRAAGKAITGQDLNTGGDADQWAKLLPADYIPSNEVPRASYGQPWCALKAFMGGDRARDAYTSAPAKPAVWGDGHYEDGDGTDPDGFNGVNGLGVRKACWLSFMNGGFYTYGKGNDQWYFSGDWKGAMESDGAKALEQFHLFWSGRKWWRLVPDHALATGENACVLRSQDGDALYVYLPEGGATTVKLGSLSGGVARARWWNTATGEFQDAAKPASGTASASFTTPGGWSDGLLALEAGSATALRGAPKPAGRKERAGSAAGERRADGREAGIWPGVTPTLLGPK